MNREQDISKKAKEMNEVYIIWMRNGFASSEWHPERVCETKECAKDSLELFEKHYPKNMGYELKVNTYKVYHNTNQDAEQVKNPCENCPPS